MAVGMTAANLESLDLWRRAMVDNVRRDAPDLSARQMAALLTVYMTAPPHTVRGLAATLEVSKPAITRALDRLSELELARRKVDPKDRRSVLVQRTVKGSVYLSELAEIIAGAQRERDRERGVEAAPKASKKAAATGRPKSAGAAVPAKATSGR